MGCAESDTTVPLGNVADAVAQSSPQLMPAGELVTLPRMRPSGVLVMLSLNRRRSNWAETLRAASIVTLQAPLPLHAPVQRTNTDPTSA